jgi:hypothetical protein
MASSSLELFSKRSHNPLTWLSNSTRPPSRNAKGRVSDLRGQGDQVLPVESTQSVSEFPYRRRFRSRKSAEFAEAHGGHERQVRTRQRLLINFAIAIGSSLGSANSHRLS